MKLWKKKTAETPPSPPPRRITVDDLLQYHAEKDTCDMCEAGEWDCPQHPYNPHNGPRAVSAVMNNKYYLGYWHGVPVQVDKDGRARSGQKIPLYASVLAGTVREAKVKFERGEVEEWLS
jgi:hypothetical protein